MSSTQHYGSTPPPGVPTHIPPTPRAGEPRPTPAAAPAMPAIDPRMAAHMGAGAGMRSIPLDFSVGTDLVHLPSEGHWYPHRKGSTLVQYMTAAEENILMDPGRLAARTQWDDLLTATVKDPDFLPPGQLIPADYTRLLLNLRISSYGSEYEVAVMDPFTSKALPAPYNKVDLSQVKNRPLVALPDENGHFTFTLPRLGKTVRFRLLTNEEFMLLLAQREQNAARGIPTAVTDRLYAQIVDVDGETNRDYIGRFVQALPAGDSAKLRIYMDEVEPALDTTMTFVSPTTGNPTFQRSIRLDDGLFYF